MKDNSVRFTSARVNAPQVADPGVATGSARPAWSYPPRRVLAPIDFGDASARALIVADGLARRHGAVLSVLHGDILEAPIYFTHEQAAAIEDERHSAADAMRREMARFVRAVVAGPAEVNFIEEAPATAIVESAAHADLIVMGTHGRRGASRWWLGSVAERVVRESPIPVLVVRAAAVATAAAEALFTRPVLVATQARSPGPSPLAGAQEGEAARYAQALAAAFGGTVSEQVLACQEDLVRQRDASLLVVPRRAPGEAWVNSRAERMLRSCTLPMLFVPDEG